MKRLSRSWCNRCGSLIAWLPTVAGKKMPVEPTPVHFCEDSGSVSVFMTEDGRCVKGLPAGASQDGAVLGYIPHFARCGK